MNWIENNSMNLLQKGLAGTWEKQKLISENIANKSTPGYKAKYTNFEDELQKSVNKLKNSNSLSTADFKAGLDRTKFNVKQSNEESTRLDGNNVDLTAEEIEFARVQLQYEFLGRQMTDQITKLRMVIEGR